MSHKSTICSDHSANKELTKLCRNYLILGTISAVSPIKKLLPRLPLWTPTHRSLSFLLLRYPTCSLLLQPRPRLDSSSFMSSFAQDSQRESHCLGWFLVTVDSLAPQSLHQAHLGWERPVVLRELQHYAAQAEHKDTAINLYQIPECAGSKCKPPHLPLFNSQTRSL